MVNKLERQVLDYKYTLEKEFHYDHLQGMYNQMVQNFTQPDHPLTGTSNKLERSVLKVWAHIKAIHMTEVNDLYNRIILLYKIFAKVPQQQPYNKGDRTKFHRPIKPDSEWIPTGHPKEWAYETHFKHPQKKPVLQALVVGAAALVFGESGTLLEWFGMRGSIQLHDNVLALNKRVDQFIQLLSELMKTHAELADMVEQALRQSALKDLYEPSILLASLQTYVFQLDIRIQEDECLIQKLQHRLLSVDFLDGKSLCLPFKDARRHAQSIGFHLLLDRPSKVFQLEASYFFNGNVLPVVLHIPIALKDSFMRL